MPLPKFKDLNADFNPAEARSSLQASVALLNKELPGTTLVDFQAMSSDGSVVLNGRYQALIADIKKRADHAGIHGFRHSMKIGAGDVPKEVLLFALEQAAMLAQIDPAVGNWMHHIANGDPADPGHVRDAGGVIKKFESGNEDAYLAAKRAGAVPKALVEKMLSEDPPPLPADEPSAADLMFFSAKTYQYLDKALWHTMRARRAKRLIDAYKKKNGGKLPVDNCSQAATAAFLLQTYFHHFHKASIYSSPMVAMVQFTTHWLEKWNAAWVGSGESDKAALRNLMPVYSTIAKRARHPADWSCDQDGGICYGPWYDPDPKKDAEAKPAKKLSPKKPMGYTDGTANFKAPIEEIDYPWAVDVAIWATDARIAVGKALDSAKDGLKGAGRAVAFEAEKLWEETFAPLLADDPSIFEDDQTDKTNSVRDTLNKEEIIKETKLQFERFEFWVLQHARADNIKAWLNDDKAVKRRLRTIVAGTHDDEKHTAQPPWETLFPGPKAAASPERAKEPAPDRPVQTAPGRASNMKQSTVAPAPAASGSKPAPKTAWAEPSAAETPSTRNGVPESRYARMMFDVYGLVEAKDLTKNIANAWKKFWAPKKKGDMAVTLLFLGAGIAVSVLTAGAGLPVIALVGIAAGKSVAKKAALKGTRKLNSKLNSSALKGSAEAPPNEKLTLTATQAREGAASLARHFVSTLKNFKRMQDVKAKNPLDVTNPNDPHFKGCRPAASYAYAAHAFEHHYVKTVAQLQNLTAMSEAVLGTLESGNEYFLSDVFDRDLKSIHDAVEQPSDWHRVHCDGLAPSAPATGGTPSGRPRIGAARGGIAYVSHTPKSCVCYASNPNNVNNSASSNIKPYGVARGLFFMDYTKAKDAAYGPFDMLEHWVNDRDLAIHDLKVNLKDIVEKEQEAIASDIKRVTGSSSSTDVEAVSAELMGAEKGKA